MYLNTTEGLVLSGFIVAMAIAIFAIIYAYWRLDNLFVTLARRYAKLHESWLHQSRSVREYREYIMTFPDGYEGFVRSNEAAIKAAEITMYPEVQDDGEVIYLPDNTIPTLEHPETRELIAALNGAKVG